jgi:hypothetical protein
MSNDRLALILQELGVKTGIHNLVLDASGSLSLQLNLPNAPLVHLHEVPQEGVLVIFARLGFAQTVSEAAIFRAFLQQNLFWEGGKGAVFAMIPETGELILQRRDAIDTLTTERLEVALEDFIDCAQTARALILTPAEDDAPDALPLSGALRV